jgi:Xaa-Pro aminopeptidase
MRQERFAKLQAGLEKSGKEAALLLGSSSVAYASGALSPGVDSAIAALSRPIALVIRGDPFPHIWTPYPDGLPEELPPEYSHPPAYPADAGSASRLAEQVLQLVGPGTKIACDDLTHPLRDALSGCELSSATALLGAAKLCKTPDELACIRAAQRINELAMSTVQHLLTPGVRQCDVTGAFLERIFQLGATSNAIDPIWQPMPLSRADGPWTTHGDVAFPTPSSDRFLRDGEVIWVDTGIQYQGYASDFGRTWIVGAGAAGAGRPNPRQTAQFERWMKVVSEVLGRCKPGATALELCRAAIAANDGAKPWLDHFYLAHGVGTDSAEMPLVGTDLGEAFDESMVLQPGMVLVLEPVIWEDGYGGYRSEDIVAITDDGWEPLSSFPYDPFEGSW